MALVDLDALDNIIPDSFPVRPRIGVIGAGNYAQNIILPIMKKSTDYQLVGLSSNSGSSVSHIGKSFGFEYSTTDNSKLFKDKKEKISFFLSNC